MYVCVVCMCNDVGVEVPEQLARASSLLPCELPSLNSGPQIWQQVSLFTEPSHHPIWIIAQLLCDRTEWNDSQS